MSSRFKRYVATVREDEGGDLRAAKCCRRSAAVRAHRHGGDVRGPIFYLRVLDWFISAEATRLGGGMCDVHCGEQHRERMMCECAWVFS